MTANLLVTLPENGDEADLTATLRVGTLTFVELGAAEEITAAGGGQTAKLEHRRAAGVTNYSNRLAGVTQAGTEITFGLKRDGDNESAPTSTVVLPERVRLVAPAAGTTYSRRAAIAVRFDSEPSQLPSILTWAGECIQPGSLRTGAGPDLGHDRPRVDQAGRHDSYSGRLIRDCQIDLTLTRRIEGTLDKAFKDGSIAAESQSVATGRIRSVIGRRHAAVTRKPFLGYLHEGTGIPVAASLRGIPPTPLRKENPSCAASPARCFRLPSPPAAARPAPHRPSATRGDFDIQAHRGGLGLTVESTIASFSHGLELGVSTLELDVQITEDGQAVVTHDRKVTGSKCKDTAPYTAGRPRVPVRRQVHQHADR